MYKLESERKTLHQLLEKFPPTHPRVIKQSNKMNGYIVKDMKILRR